MRFYNVFPAKECLEKCFHVLFFVFEFRTDEDRNMLHRYMSHAALSDLDWEVKLVAMEFWENVIQEGFNQEGIAESWSLPEDEPNLPQYPFLLLLLN